MNLYLHSENVRIFGVRGAPGVTSGNPVWIFREWKDDAVEASAKEQTELGK